MEKTAEAPKSRVCPKCLREYLCSTYNFYLDSQKPFGLSYRCKYCLREDKRIAHAKIAPKQKEIRRLKRIEIENDLEYQKRKKELSIMNSRAAKKRYRDKNRKEINRKWAEKYRNGLIKPVSKETRSIYKSRAYQKMINDPFKKVIHYGRGRMNCLIKKKRMSFKHKNYILFTRDEFISHIESLFKEGMAWDNYGRHGWHVDHIRPLSSFNLDNYDEYTKAWNLSNLQPLWAKDNLSKGSKILCP